MNTKQVQEHLRYLGWPIEVDGSWGPNTKQAVEDFQRGFAFYRLMVDGYAGPNTQTALRRAMAEGGRCSPNFRFKEFASKGNGWIKVHRLLVLGLEKYRDHFGPVTIISAYRDPIYNRSPKIKKSKPNSIHLYGGAVDIPAKATLEQVKRLKVFSGIGYNKADRTVRHVDIRGQGDVPATTSGTIHNPSIWPY